MTRSEFETAYARYRAAQDEFFYALVGIKPDTQPAPERPRPTSRARPAASQAAEQALPKPLTKGPKEVVLTDEQRASVIEAATNVAVRVMKAVGEGAMLVPGVQGQLALERIPFDDALIQQAIDAARATV